MIGSKILKFNQLESTNDTAMKMADQGAEHGTVVIAFSQTKGRGRFNKKWLSPNGGLWLSIILKPEIAAKDAAKITVLLSMAIAKMIEKEGGGHPKIKWPNDIMLDDDKTAGILVEMKSEIDRINYIVAGIGLNVNISGDDLKEIPNATSMQIYYKRMFDIMDIFNVLIKEINVYYNEFEQKGFKPILNEWKYYLWGKGRKIKIKTSAIQGHETQAEIFGVNDQGHLMARTEYGTIEYISSGEIEYL